jgi:hypothetical protein
MMKAQMFSLSGMFNSYACLTMMIVLILHALYSRCSFVQHPHLQYEILWHHLKVDVLIAVIY